MDRPLAGVPAVCDLFAPTSLTTSFMTKPYDRPSDRLYSSSLTGAAPPVNARTRGSPSTVVVLIPTS